jgi:short-subunit dehydrogenase
VASSESTVQPRQTHASGGKRFKGRVVLVTGASSGIGCATARAFAAEGASLMLAARRADRIQDLATELNASGSHCTALATDIQQYAQVSRLVQETVRQLGRLDILVNCAGVGVFGDFEGQSWEAIERVMRTNLDGAMAMCHAAIPQMLKQGSGVILNVSSVVGKRSAPQLTAYCASKFGLWGFSQALALELAPHNIHVCHFCPTLTATEFHKAAGLEEAHGARGMHSPDQVAQALLSAVEKRKREHIMSLTERVLIKCHLLAPGFTDRLLSLARRKPKPHQTPAGAPSPE